MQEVGSVKSLYVWETIGELILVLRILGEDCLLFRGGGSPRFCEGEYVELVWTSYFLCGAKDWTVGRFLGGVSGGWALVSMIGIFDDRGYSWEEGDGWI